MRICSECLLEKKCFLIVFQIRDALRAEIGCLPKIPTTVQKASVTQKRRKLHTQVVKSNELAALFSPGAQLGVASSSDDPGFCNGKEGDPIEDEASEKVFWEREEDWEDEEDSENLLAENFMLTMPSAWGAARLKNGNLEGLVNEEVQLYIGQANDCLEKLRTHLGQKSVLYRMNF